MNTQRAESPVINSAGQRPVNRNRAWNQALKGRNQQDLGSFRVHPNDRALPYPNDYALSGQSANYPPSRICNPRHNRMFVERTKNGTDYKSAPASLIFCAMDSCLRRNDARKSL